MPIAIVSIPVADQDRAKAFYTDVMGFAVPRDDPMGPQSRWIQLQPPGGGASITLVNWFDAMPPGCQQGLMLGVADVDAEHARLAKLGMVVTAISAEAWGRYTMLSDPDGNRWVVATLSAG
ncbi:hypothetical protein SAMN06295912_109141 [Sphingomonas laterariae]|uniref:VOC domain-containing protein n=1 Tax=Edaphosphingomonas laterariae TaxID=861865 RepID=A0A239FNN6_9SPHN|nr:VOC family protein [Sphingomonas laterariae]SNS58576.1 hypothetical protein SAMN06295912_109141 [Sphingomonas laterariae]